MIMHRITKFLPGTFVQCISIHTHFNTLINKLPSLNLILFTWVHLVTEYWSLIILSMSIYTVTVTCLCFICKIHMPLCLYVLPSVLMHCHNVSIAYISIHVHCGSYILLTSSTWYVNALQLYVWWCLSLLSSLLSGCVYGASYLTIIVILLFICLSCNEHVWDLSAQRIFLPVCLDGFSFQNTYSHPWGSFLILWIYCSLYPCIQTMDLLAESAECNSCVACLFLLLFIQVLFVWLIETGFSFSSSFSYSYEWGHDSKSSAENQFYWQVSHIYRQVDDNDYRDRQNHVTREFWVQWVTEERTLANNVCVLLC